MTTVRKGQAPAKLNRDEFHVVFSRDFYDPAYLAVAQELAAIEEVAWRAYADSHKAPVTVKAGPGFLDPDYDLSIEWKEAHHRLVAAEARQKDPATPTRILLINGAARNDGSCPGGDYLAAIAPLGWLSSRIQYLAVSDRPPPAFTSWKVAMALSFWPAFA